METVQKWKRKNENSKMEAVQNWNVKMETVQKRKRKNKNMRTL